MNISAYNKAFVAAIFAAGTAVLPAVQDAINTWVSGVIGVVVTTAGVFLARNKPPIVGTRDV